MESIQTREMNLDELDTFITLELIPESRIDELFDVITNTDGGWVLKAIQKRFLAHKIDVDKRIMIAILSIGDGTVGVCAKHVDYIATLSSKMNYLKIEWSIFTQKIYPTGIPVL